MIATTALIAALEENILRTRVTFCRKGISRWGIPVRQFTLSAMAAAFLAACGSNEPQEGQIGHLSDNFGATVSDEPRSALIGRDILSSGGNAVDAVVATYFALAVTYPGAATLGGGGICVAFKGENDRPATIDFRPRLYQHGGRVVMIPGSVRGMFALHARFGSLKWEGLLLPAERLARFGNPVSRAFATKLNGLPRAAFADRGIEQIFLKKGKPVREGQVLHQLELSATLAQIRLRGAGDFYAGELAKALIAGLGEIKGTNVPLSAIRDYRPKWSDPEIVNVGNDQLLLPAGPPGAALAAQWNSGGSGRPDRDRSPDSVGFAAIDIGGGAAACVVSANGALGAGRLIGSTGILMAAPPHEGGFTGAPMVLINKPLLDARGAATGAGGSDALQRTVRIARRVFIEDAAPAAAYRGARPRGIARVNVVSCPKGAREEPDLCSFAVDPSGHGLAAGAQP